MITIEFNGETTELTAALNIEQLLAHQHQEPQGIAVVLNGNIVTRSEWANTLLNDHAKVRVFRAIAGG
ncbi:MULTISPECIES: sulfur carrier protein ThiS [unclassified Agarivorans]|uniref:sulfur carrier protein ThiS n=1 Tax=unclassified Agarivorans TaxID=2636026 RepID=UPI0026E3946F|nr:MULTISPECIES: sulfur carrier protein ThiS [unclassified Agarivorans]MDO6686614.1 sulfur carrier protein ThiS [Agarivorans sp. 3_MG-2023]MDO6715432.1 sulfur carrier protein ThiS [Agarivorans sp. 2_MG-2023]MDO6763251.1 sulfur carrier protein ThiS [Agarivorans sp. 1_MG-2023]